jgi:lipopolysaccharide export system permease protein
MRLHDRYLLRELLTPLAFCLGAFLIFATVFFFMKELDTIQEKKLGLMDIAAYCGVSLVEFFVIVLPILLLLALLYALAQHTRHNEINALRAAGVGLWRLCLPYFAVGLLATGIYFALNELVVPNCGRWAQQILDRHVKAENDPQNSPRVAKGFSNPRAHRLWQFFEYDEPSTRMQNLTVTWTLPNGSWRALQADHAVRTNGIWTFFNVELYAQANAHTNLEPECFTNVLAMPEFDETPERIRLLLKFGDAQTLHGTGTADIPLRELWEFMQHNPGLRPEDARALATKFYGRLAEPWECLVVVLVAIPFGAQSGRRNLFFGVAGSIFIGFLYIVLQRISLALGMNGELPGWLAAWLPNLIFATLGVVLTLRAR